MRRRFAFHQRLSRNASLVVSGGGQAWVANHVADRVNVRQGGLIHAVDLQLTAAVGFKPDIFQLQGIGVAGTAVGVQEAVRFQLLA